MNEPSADAGELSGKTALITGAAHTAGIGMGTARRLAELGCDVALSDIELRWGELEANAESLEDEFSVRAMAVAIDVADRRSVDDGVASVADRLGSLDVVINNAGTVFGAPTPLHEYDETEWLRTFDVNLNGTLRMCQAAVAVMGDGGSIVNVASMAGKVPAPLNGAYSVSKASIMMLTRVMAVELGPLGIRVNSICPGLIDTELQRLNVALKAHVAGVDEAEAERRMLGAVPLARMGSIEEVGDLCAFLASDRSSYMTGQALNITGGMLTAT